MASPPSWPTMVGMAVATTVPSIAARNMLSMTPSVTSALDLDTRGDSPA